MGLENLTPQMGSLERMVIYKNGCLTPLSQMAEDNSALKSEAVAGLTALFSPVKKQVRLRGTFIHSVPISPLAVIQL